MSIEKFKILRVTMTRDYLIEMHDEERSYVNGWTIDEIVKDWFEMKGSDAILEYHAARDGSRIGNSTRYIKHEVLDPKDIKK